MDKKGWLIINMIISFKCFILKYVQKYTEYPDQVKASFWFALCGFIQKGISFLTTPIFSRLLTTEEYGIFSLFCTWQNIIIIIASLNLAAGVYLRGLIKYEEDAIEFTKSLQSLYIINTVIVFIVYCTTYAFWDDIINLPQEYVFLLFVDILVQVSFQFWSARERVNFKYKQLVVITIINAVIKPLSGIVAILLFENRIDARIFSMVIADVVTFGRFFMSIFFSDIGFFSTKYWKYALRYNLPLIPHYLSQIVLNQSDRIMISAITGKGDAGIYSLAYSIAVIMTIINQSIINTYSPWMFKEIKDGEYNKIGFVSMRLLFIVGIANLTLIIFAPEVIMIMAPPSYYKAIWVIPPVAASVYFMFMYNLFSNFEFYYDKTILMMIASFFCAVLNIILNYFYINKYGFLAAGYTTLICYMLYCIFHYVVMKIIIEKELNGYRVYDILKIIILSIFFVSIAVLFMMLYKLFIIRYLIIFIAVTVGIIFRDRIKILIRIVMRLKK